jgi:hypothetical protein
MRLVFLLFGMLLPLGPYGAAAQEKGDVGAHNFSTLSADSRQLLEALKTKSAAELRTIFHSFDTKALTGIDPGLPPKAPPPVWSTECSPSAWASAVHAIEIRELCELAGDKAKGMAVCAKAVAKP